jgi:hypothetical protein
MRYYPGICMQGLRKSAEFSVRIAGVPTELRTEPSSNTSHRYANPLGSYLSYK